MERLNAASYWACNSLQIYRESQVEGRSKIGMKLANRVRSWIDAAAAAQIHSPGVTGLFLQKAALAWQAWKKILSSSLCTDLRPKSCLEKKTLTLQCSSLNCHQSISKTASVSNVTHLFARLLFLPLLLHIPGTVASTLLSQSSLNLTFFHDMWQRSIFMLFVSNPVLFAMPLSFPALKHLIASFSYLFIPKWRGWKEIPRI